jgi:hypothetical protein
VPGGGACNRELPRIPLPRTRVNKGKERANDRGYRGYIVTLDDLPRLSLNSVRSSHTGQRRAACGDKRSHASTVGEVRTLCSAVLDKPFGHLGRGALHHLSNQAHHSMNPASRVNFAEFHFYEVG